MLKNHLKSFFEGHKRTVKAKKHIAYSLIIKGVSILIGLIFVPLILKYLDAERYGIWLTLSSILAWFSFFDVGLGNGLRNRLAESIAKKNYVLARTYISTTYAILGIVFGIAIFIFLFVNPFLNWSTILNTTKVANSILSKTATLVFIFFILSFFFKLIGNILLADQRPAVNNGFSTLANGIALILVFILTKTTDGSIFYLAIIMSGCPVLVLLLANIYFFKNDYRKISPSLKYVDFSKARDLLGLGFKFFYLRIAVIIIYSSTNLFIAQFSNQEVVTSYNISYKYLSIVYMIFSIILSPIWSAVTDAYVKNEFSWLKNTLKNLNLLLLGFSSILLILLILSPYVYNLWIGNKVLIPHSLNLLVSIYILLLLINANYSAFINGIGKLKLSLFLITFVLVVFLPGMYILGKAFGVNGVLIAMILAQMPSVVLQPIQVYKIINKKAKGIWNV